MTRCGFGCLLRVLETAMKEQYVNPFDSCQVYRCTLPACCRAVFFFLSSSSTISKSTTQLKATRTRIEN